MPHINESSKSLWPLKPSHLPLMCIGLSFGWWSNFGSKQLLFAAFKMCDFWLSSVGPPESRKCTVYTSSLITDEITCADSREVSQEGKGPQWTAAPPHSTGGWAGPWKPGKRGSTGRQAERVLPQQIPPRESGWVHWCPHCFRPYTRSCLFCSHLQAKPNIRGEFYRASAQFRREAEVLILSMTDWKSTGLLRLLPLKGFKALVEVTKSHNLFASSQILQEIPNYCH